MMDVNGYNSNNAVRLISSGKEYFDIIIEMINHAQVSIQLQTYIFSADQTGTKVVNALIDAANRKVTVYMLIDGYASQGLSDSFVKKMLQAGIHFRFFRPPLRSSFFYFTRRLHHKLLVTDASKAVVGGLNIADRYNDTNEKKAWLDFAVWIEGDTAKKLDKICTSMWVSDSYEMDITLNKNNTPNVPIPENKQCDVRIRLNDWVWHKNQISSAYIEMFRNAKKDITILCTYFLPGKVMRRQMSRASKKGIKIRVVSTGKSDVWLTKNAERWLYDWLLRNEIELYEYQNNVLHGKVALYDDIDVTIGSYNINNLSAYASIELNVEVRNRDFALKVKNTLNDIIEKNCIHITREVHLKSKNLIKQFYRWLSYQFIYLVFRIFQIYFKRKI